jgi:hypothetical protein
MGVLIASLSTAWNGRLLERFRLVPGKMCSSVSVMFFVLQSAQVPIMFFFFFIFLVLGNYGMPAGEVWLSIVKGEA